MRFAESILPLAGGRAAKPRLSGFPAPPEPGWSTRELMREVRRLRIVTDRLVGEQLSGAYHSVFKGHGVEFEEVREYTPEDDVRTIDWNVTARLGRPFVKRFREERELTVFFLVDVSGSQRFGSALRSKAETAAALTCVLALSAVRNQDKAGLVLFSDRIERYVRPARGRTAALRLVREVLAAGGTDRGTDIAGALRFLCRVRKRRCVAFLVSDFLDENCLGELRTAARRHDVICCQVADPRERSLARAGVLEVQDPETGEVVRLDTGSRAVRRRFARRSEAEQKALAEGLRRLRIDLIPLSTDSAFGDVLRRFFERRRRRKGRARRGGAR